MAQISEVTNQDEKSRITKRILRELPDWFELESGIAEYINGVKNKPFFVAEFNGKAVGFASVDDNNDNTSEIYVMGILPENRRGGIGGKLVECIWNRNQELGKKFLIVKTLDESAGDKSYEETRRFYLKMGFLPLFSTTEIWGEGNPCLIMIKVK
jgi:GNAT superfamily N-acetyltransferase